METTRRKILMSTLFGAGYVGLRALATGIPAGLLLKGSRAFADGAPTCASNDKAQYIIMSTSGAGDPINANAPGSYVAGTSHPLAQTMAKTPLTLGGNPTFAAKPWAGLPQTTVLDRAAFFHIATLTPVHPKQPDVQRLMGAAYQNEMLPSVLAKQLAPCFNTVQTQPITVGATSPSEGLSFGGAALPIIPPLALKATLVGGTGPLKNLQSLRNQTLADLADVYKGSASSAQKKYLDSLIASQDEIKNLNTDLLDMLNNIMDNSVDAQITAAVALIRMNVTPVVSIHIPFGGDNHSDNQLNNETTQTISGVQSIATLMQALSDASLADKTTFMSLNVFGRTLDQSHTNGRNHNELHQVSIAIGKPFKGGVVGGVGPVAPDFGALSINSTTGKAGGDIPAGDTLASFGKTMLAAVGVDSGTIDTAITGGKVIKGALVSP